MTVAAHVCFQAEMTGENDHGRGSDWIYVCVMIHITIQNDHGRAKTASSMMGENDGRKRPWSATVVHGRRAISRPRSAKTRVPFEAKTRVPFEAKTRVPFEAKTRVPFEAKTRLPFGFEAKTTRRKSPHPRTRGRWNMYAGKELGTRR